MAMNQATKQSLEGSTILVTGGAGLIGSHIVDCLLYRSQELVEAFAGESAPRDQGL